MVPIAVRVNRYSLRTHLFGGHLDDYKVGTTFGLLNDLAGDTLDVWTLAYLNGRFGILGATQFLNESLLLVHCRCQGVKLILQIMQFGTFIVDRFSRVMLFSS